MAPLTKLCTLLLAAVLAVLSALEYVRLEPYRPAAVGAPVSPEPAPAQLGSGSPDGPSGRSVQLIPLPPD